MLTEKELEFFSDHVSNIIEYLGLRRWSISVEWNDDPDDTADASVLLNKNQNRAKFLLNKNLKLNSETIGRLRMLAMHECLHVLLYELYYYTSVKGYPRSILREEVDSAEHRVINTLAPLLDHAMDL